MHFYKRLAIFFFVEIEIKLCVKFFKFWLVKSWEFFNQLTHTHYQLTHTHTDIK